jgi:phage terminase small subunit
MSRPRTPTNILELRGAFKRNPQRKRGSEPEPVIGIGPAPKWFDVGHRDIWAELTAQYAASILTVSDRLALEILCCLVQEYREDPTVMSGAKIARMEALDGKFGGTPAGRAKLTVPKKQDENPFSDF